MSESFVSFAPKPNQSSWYPYDGYGYQEYSRYPEFEYHHPSISFLYLRNGLNPSVFADVEQTNEKPKTPTVHQSKKKPKGYISAFNFFAVRARHYLGHEFKNMTNNEINKYVGQLWKKIPETDRAIFHNLAHQDKIRYLKEVHAYNTYNGGNLVPTINPPPGYGFDGELLSKGDEPQKIKRPRTNYSLFTHQAMLDCSANLVQLANVSESEFEFINSANTEENQGKKNHKNDDGYGI